MTVGMVLLDRSVGMEMRGFYRVARQCASEVARQITPPQGGFVPVVAFDEYAERVSRDAVVDLPHSMRVGVDIAAALLQARRCMVGKRGRLVVFSVFGPTSYTPSNDKASKSLPVFSFPPTRMAIGKAIEAIELAGVNGLVLDAFCEPQPSQHAAAEVLPAVAAVGGQVTFCTVEDCQAAVDEYLKRRWS